MKGAASARERCRGLESFWRRKGVDPRSEKWRMMTANQAIQRQARLWYAARRNALDGVVRSDEEKQVGPALSSASGPKMSKARSVFFRSRHSIKNTQQTTDA